MKNFVYIGPLSLGEATSALEEKDSQAIAGGTDLLTVMKLKIKSPARLINLKSVPGISEITRSDGEGLLIGALATLDSIGRDSVIHNYYPVIQQAATSAASPQLRNRGTAGGNLCQEPRCPYYRSQLHCWIKGGERCFARDGENSRHAIFSGGPCFTVFPSDLAPALISYGAEITLAGPGGERRLLLEDFYRRPAADSRRFTSLLSGEIVTGIKLPAPCPGWRGRYLKAAERKVWSFALVSLAVNLDLNGDKVQDARLTAGGVAPMPWRLESAESALRGQALDDTVIEKAAEAAVSGAKPLAKNGFKIPLLKGLVKEALNSLK